MQLSSPAPTLFNTTPAQVVSHTSNGCGIVTSAVLFTVVRERGLVSMAVRQTLSGIDFNLIEHQLAMGPLFSPGYTAAN